MKNTPWQSSSQCNVILLDCFPKRNILVSRKILSLQNHDTEANTLKMFAKYFKKMNLIYRGKIHQSSTWHNIVLLFLRHLVYLQGNRRSLLAHDWISACGDALCLTPGGWHSLRQDFERRSHFQIYNRNSAGWEAFWWESCMPNCISWGLEKVSIHSLARRNTSGC